MTNKIQKIDKNLWEYKGYRIYKKNYHRFEILDEDNTMKLYAPETFKNAIEFIDSLN